MSFIHRRGNMHHRGQYRRGPAARPRSNYRKAEMETGLTAPLGTIIKSLGLDDLKSSSEGAVARADGAETIASFNLMGGPRVAITVPGMPPRWTPVDKPRALAPDAGTYYRDINAAHNPRGSWHATVEALLRKPTIEPFQIIACANTMEKLMTFASGDPCEFRILVHQIGGLVHLTRRDCTPKTTIPDVYGYGHAFPEANTTWDKSVAGSTSHQRVVKYCFAGLNIAVRFEADGYMSSKVKSLSNVNTIPSPSNDDHEARCSIESLEKSFANLEHRTREGQGGGALEIKAAGAEVPEDAIFDLKTRTIKRLNEEQDIVAGQLPRLWIRRIPTMVLAFHQSGLFTVVHELNVKADVLKWEDENQDTLRRLAELLRVIIATVEAEPSKKMEITPDSSRSTLCFREQLDDAPPLFPEATARRWEERLANCGHFDLSDSESGDESSDEKRGVSVTDDGTQLGDLTVCDEECGYCGRCK